MRNCGSRAVDKMRCLQFEKIPVALALWLETLYQTVMQEFCWYLGPATEASRWELQAVCQHTAQILVIRRLTVALANVKETQDTYLVAESLCEDCRCHDRSRRCLSNRAYAQVVQGQVGLPVQWMFSPIFSLVVNSTEKRGHLLLFLSIGA